MLGFGTFTLGIDGFVLAGLLPQVASDLGTSEATAGQLTTIFAFTYAVGSPIIASLTGRFDRRWLLAVGMAVFIVGMVFQAAGGNFGVVVLGRVIAALGAAAYQANAYAVAGVASSDERRARSLAFVATGGSLALVAGLPFGVLLGQWVGWRGVMWVLVALAVVTGSLVALLPAVYTPPTSLRTRLGTLGRGPVLLLLLGASWVLVPAFLVLSYAPTVLHSTGAMVVLGILAFGAGQVVGTRLVSTVIGRRSALFAMLVGSGGTAVAMLAMALAQPWTLATVAAFVAVGFFVGLSIVPQQHRYFSVAPDVAPVALGLNGSAINIGSMLGAAFGGLILSSIGVGWLAPIGALVASLGVVYLYVTAPERRTKR